MYFWKASCKLHGDHPFKTSAFFRGGGVSPLPMFANLRGVGVSGMPMSAIFETKSLNYCTEYLLFFMKSSIYLFFPLNYCRDIIGYLKLGGQAVMWRIIAVWRHLLFCQKLEGQLPSLTTLHLTCPCISLNTLFHQQCHDN